MTNCGSCILACPAWRPKPDPFYLSASTKSYCTQKNQVCRTDIVGRLEIRDQILVNLYCDWARKLLVHDSLVHEPAYSMDKGPSIDRSWLFGQYKQCGILTTNQNLGLQNKPISLVRFWQSNQSKAQIPHFSNSHDVSGSS